MWPWLVENGARYMPQNHAGTRADAALATA
jgi:hypothetical protein